MRTSLLFSLLLCIVFQNNAQTINCPPPLEQTDLHANNIKARIQPGGRLFSNTSTPGGQFILHPDAAGKGPSTISSASFWMGGQTANGVPAMTGFTFGYFQKPNFWKIPGQGDTLLCTEWDQLFNVKGARIATFLYNLPQYAGNSTQAALDFPEIMGWPGAGNPFFTNVTGYEMPPAPHGLAPFMDTDGDGIYNPMHGDYPAVHLQGFEPFVPAQIVWGIFPIKLYPADSFNIELQQTAWAFNCTDKPVLNNSVFTAFKIINLSAQPLDSCFIDVWTDMDIGCWTDDFIGSLPALSSFYGYNQDAVDGSVGDNCPGNLLTFGNHPPAQSVTMLSRSMDRFMYYNNGNTGNWPNAMTDPDQTPDYYNYLRGIWADGTPLTYGGSGYNPAGGVPTNYAFPNLPSDPNGWSMCSTGLGIGDRRALGIHNIGQFLPGQTEELVVGWTAHENISLPCGIDSIVGEITSLRSEFQDHFSSVCSALTPVHAPTPVRALEIFPNPANTIFTLRFGAAQVSELRLFAADGRCLRVERNLPGGDLTLGVEDLPNGLYTVQALGTNGLMVGKLTVLR